MTKELFIDLCARLPYDVKIKIPTLQEDTVFTLVGICENYITVMKDNGSCFDVVYTSIDCFPLLRPMSLMTEEEENEYFDKRKLLVLTIFGNYESVDWLNKHHFDYRRLIEKGLAIAVTEENNPYKE